MANEAKDPISQRNRIAPIVMLLMAEKYKNIPHAIDYDVDSDRVRVLINDSPVIRLGPKERFMSDAELRDLLSAQLHNVLRTNLPD